MRIEDIKGTVEPVCRSFGVGRLEAFGSVARGDSDLNSDLDLLVEFHDPDHTPARRFFGLLHELEDLLGTDVDLITAGSLRNPYFRERVMREKVLVYEG